MRDIVLSIMFCIPNMCIMVLPVKGILIDEVW